MLKLINAIRNIWKMDDDFCCFCFSKSPDPLTHIEDQICVIIKDTETIMPMSEILCTVLDYEILDYVSTFKQICKTCTQLAVNSYIFIKTTKVHSDLLQNAIGSMLNSLQNDQEVINYNNKLFLTLNSKNFVTKHFCDMEKPINTLSVINKSPIHLQKDSQNSTPIQDVTHTSHKEKICYNDTSIFRFRTKDFLYENDSESIRCKLCLKSYSSLTILRNHYIRIHAPKNYKCGDCNKGFGSPACLEMHRSDYHSTYVCSKCGKAYKSRHKFKTHEVSHNSRIVCPDCGRDYKNEVTYKNHIENVCNHKTRASPANAKYTCDYCNKKYTQKATLRVHIQYEHLNYKNHYCRVCNKKFWAQSRLKAHMVKHTKEKKFLCTICNGKFVTKESLLYHTRIHTGERPYKCSCCQARFLSASRRADHVKRHHLNATVECDICHFKFSTESYLQKHKRSHLEFRTNVQCGSSSFKSMKC